MEFTSFHFEIFVFIRGIVTEIYELFKNISFFGIVFRFSPEEIVKQDLGREKESFLFFPYLCYSRGCIYINRHFAIRASTYFETNQVYRKY